MGIQTEPNKTWVFGYVVDDATPLPCVSIFDCMRFSKPVDRPVPTRHFLLIVKGTIESGSLFILISAEFVGVHHRYVDTKTDPYSVNKGFWYAQIGRMALKQDTRQSGGVDGSNFIANNLGEFQHRNYFPIAPFFGFVLLLAVDFIS